MNEPHKEEQIFDQFKGLYKKNAPMLIFFAGKFVDPATAEDIVQDVFLKIWNKRAFVFLKEGINTYLFNSVRHACLDYFKRQEVKSNYENSIAIKLKIEELYYNDDPQSLFFEDERLTDIYKEIENLPEKCREVFTMAYLEERKTSEIAILLNLSKRTVEAQLYKALKTIRNALLMCSVLFM